MFKYTVIILFFNLLVIQSRHSEILAQREKVVTENLSVDQGLSYNLVTDITQDKKGFMWFGTADGINRFDGYDFKVFKPFPNDTNSLTAAFVNGIFTDSYGTIWVNTIGYLHRFNETDNTFIRILQGAWFTSMCEDTSGSLNSGMWFTTYGQGLYWWDRKQDKFVRFRHEIKNLNSISCDSLLSVLVDNSGMLWIGTAKGLNSMDNSRKNIDYYPDGPNCQIYEIREDPSSNAEIIWMGTANGLYCYDKRTHEFHNFNNPFASKKNPEDHDVRTLFFDSNGTLWVGMIGGIAGFDIPHKKFFTYNNQVQSYPWAYLTKAWLIQEDPSGTIWALAHGGTSFHPLLRFDSKLKRFVQYPESPEYPILSYSMFIDKLGTMWLGTYDRGVLKIDGCRKPFNNYLNTPELNKDGKVPVIAGITEDISGDIWLGSNNGLYRFDPANESFMHYKNNQKNPLSLSSNEIEPVVADQNDNIWIGGDGLKVYDKEKNVFFHLKDYWVSSLLETRDGHIWIGKENGELEEFIEESNSFRLYQPDYSGTFDHIIMLGLVEDIDGILWYILRGTGLVSFNREKNIFKIYSDSPKPYTLPTSLGILGLSVLLADSKGNLWIGTDAGVVKYEKNTKEFSAITERDGLANQYIRSIIEDDNGFIWFGTTKGISKYDPQLKKFWNFDVNDGLKFGQVIQTTGCKTRKGELYFGGNNGFVRFHPDSIRPNLSAPAVFITSFKKFGKEVKLDSAITEKKYLDLSYKDNVISFEFVALNYSSTQKNQYAYKLEGFDKDWIYCGTSRSATYTNLDGGSYTFCVKGSNNDGIWNEKGTSLIIVITPPVWQTWWFRIIVLVVLFFLVGGTIRFIERHKLKRKIEKLEQERVLERERERISQDMHDEVGSSLSEIAILSELAKKKPEEAKHHVQEISERAAEVIDSVSDIVWAMNPQNDKLDNLTAHIRRYAVKYLNLANIRCVFKADEYIPAWPLSAEVRRNIFLVVKEVLHNIVKHSSACEVSFSIKLSDAQISIVIKDNGKGFLINELYGRGNGLTNIRKRIEDIGGKIQIESYLGKGTHISFSVNIT